MSTPPPLTITVDGRTYPVAAADAPITLGREFPSAITLADQRISRVHLRVEVAAGSWVGVDLSRNGVFVAGTRQASFPLTDGLTVHLGNPDGIPVTFALADADAAPPAAPVAAPASEDDDEDVEDAEAGAIDPDIARAGAAVAARRAELDLSRRLLARDGIINAGTLNSLEKGKHWPKASTLRKLEEALGWAPGAIGRLRDGQGGDPAEATVALTSTVAASHMAQATAIALEAIRARTALLPDPADPAFTAPAAGILDELRRLERLTADAARTGIGAAEVTVALAGVRTTYRDLMLTAARSPHASLGQRLYAARDRNRLTEAEAATAAGVSPETIANAEAGQPLSAAEVTAIDGLLAALGG